MKVDIQTILNVCFAICITAFIYQNNSLKDDVETLKRYAQLDTDKAWERMDLIEDKIRVLYTNWEQQDEFNKDLKITINSNVERADDVVSNQKILINKVEKIENYLVENF